MAFGLWHRPIHRSARRAFTAFGIAAGHGHNYLGGGWNVGDGGFAVGDDDVPQLRITLSPLLHPNFPLESAPAANSQVRGGTLGNGLRTCRRDETLVFEGTWSPLRFTDPPRSSEVIYPLVEARHRTRGVNVKSS